MTNSNCLVLYHNFPSRAVPVLWLIKELGLEVKTVKKDFEADNSACLHTPEFLKINPSGKLPVLVDGDAVVAEFGACMLYILEKYADGKLQPPMSDSAGRAKFLKFIFQAETELQSNFAMMGWYDIYQPEEARRRPQVVEVGKTSGLKALAVLEKELEGKQYLVNNEFSAADISVGFATFEANVLGMLDGFPNVVAHTARLKGRPIYQQVFRADDSK